MEKAYSAITSQPEWNEESLSKFKLLAIMEPLFFAGNGTLGQTFVQESQGDFWGNAFQSIHKHFPDVDVKDLRQKLWDTINGHPFYYGVN